MESATAVPGADVSDVEGASSGSNGDSVSSEPKLLDKAGILARRGRRYKTFPVRAWDGALVRIQSMTAAERDNFEDSVQKTDPKSGKSYTDLRNARAKLCVLTMVDDQGKRLFGDEDVKAVGQLDASAINEIFEETSAFNGILKKDIEELVGNSRATDTDDS